MSWLGKLLGQRSAAEWLEHAQAAWNDNDFGRAKQSYEAARDAKQASAEQRTQATARVIECRDRLAEARIKEAETLLAHRDEQSLELARAELKSALEIGSSEELLQRARALAEDIERGEARQHVAEIEGDAADVIAAIAGSWELEQAEEYDSHGAELTDALIALHQGHVPEALSVLSKLLETAKDPHYLCFEVGRAQLANGERDAGVATLQRFLKSIGPDEGGESRLVAHMEIASVAKERGDFDGAVAELEAAVDALPDDPRPYLALGVFLRKEGHASEAIEVLSAAQAVLGESKRQWRLLQELGLAHAANGDKKRGIELLEQVIQSFASQRLTDFPRDTAAPLAALHEAEGNKARAADLYASLAAGSDLDHLYEHHLAAGRLLLELDQATDGVRMLQKARELARNDAERQAAEALVNAAR